MHFGGLASLFNRARSKTDAFAKLALGWGSKWRVAMDAMPFTQGNRNAAFLKQQFEEQVLSGAELEQSMKQCVNEFLADMRSIENQMLVDIKADIAELPGDYSITSLSEAELQAYFEEAIANANRTAGEDLGSDVSSQLVSLVVGEVLTQVAIRLGVSAGILSTGAASGWATLGVGLLAGIIIDQLVNTVWNQWNDPHGNLVDVLNHQLDVMQNAICNGDETTQGIQQQFEIIATKRASLRHAAMQKILGVETTILGKNSDQESN
jgi:hypothetical protein